MRVVRSALLYGTVNKARGKKVGGGRNSNVTMNVRRSHCGEKDNNSNKKPTNQRKHDRGGGDLKEGSGNEVEIE